MRALVIGKIWPEPASSAAGRRTLDILRSFTAEGWETHFACAAQQSPHSAALAGSLPLSCHAIALNDSSFDRWVGQLAPDIVLFDRFMTEEQFGWRVERTLPQALRTLDTSDLHFLREARHQKLKTGKALDLQRPTALREVASILRCDLSLLISEFEMDLLHTEFNLPESLIAYWPFCLPEPSGLSPAFEQRQGFVMIGSFRHEPNWDAVRWCRESIWPLVRQRLPEATIDVFGSYLPEKARQMDRPEIGFSVRGRARDAIETLQRYRVSLAPLRFGAGLKGKLADAFLAGTPSVATSIAAEGMAGDLPWGSPVSDEAQAIAEAAIHLHQDETAWSAARDSGYRIAHRRFAESYWLPQLTERLSRALAERDANRRANFVGQLLRHHQHRSAEYMSRWIEAKNQSLE